MSERRAAMGGQAAVIVPKRLGRGLFAALCLLTAHTPLVLASCEPEHAPMAARVASAAR